MFNQKGIVTDHLGEVEVRRDTGITQNAKDPGDE